MSHGPLLPRAMSDGAGSRCSLCSGRSKASRNPAAPAPAAWASGGAQPAAPAHRSRATPLGCGQTSGNVQGARTTKEGQFIPVFGPTMVRRGAGEPDLKSWYLPNSTAVGVLKLETQTSPKRSTATP